MSDAPKNTCPFCKGTGYKHGRKGLGHGQPDCTWCDGLGASFMDVVLRGHPAFEGRADVIEGPGPVHLSIEHEGRTLLFTREASPVPPYWFVKEDGKQVYRFTAALNEPVQLPAI